jgi:hypothetical protein
MGGPSSSNILEALQLMKIKDLEKELAEARWACKLEDDMLNTTDELLAKVEETSRRFGAKFENQKKRQDSRGSSGCCERSQYKVET